MGPTGMSQKSKEIVRLVESVEQLTDADQHRIIRIVNLLTRVPASVQRRTQRMLRELLDADPESVVECVEGIDEVIEYLENEAIVHNGPTALFESLDRIAKRRSDWPN